MKSLLLICSLICLVSSISNAVIDGNEPYTPTKLEWLTAKYKSECDIWFGNIPTLAYGLFNLNGKANTITILVRYDEESQLARIHSAADTCERNMKALAREKGWTWLKVDRDIGSRIVKR